MSGLTKTRGPSPDPAAPAPGSGERREPGLDAVLFDLGDTLIHFATSRAAVIIQHTCRPAYDHLVGLGHRMPTFSSYIRTLKRQFLAEWMRSKISRREIRLMRCLGRMHRRFGTHHERELSAIMRDRAPAAMQAITTVDPEARPMLETLRDMGVAMGVISNTPFPAFAIDNYLEQKSLLEFFPVRIYSSDVGYMKPDARIFRIALEEMGIRAERSLYVGDRVDKDVRGSKRVGMTSVQFCKGAPAVQGRIRPDHRITRLAELPDIVNQLRPCGSI